MSYPGDIYGADRFVEALKNPVPEEMEGAERFDGRPDDPIDEGWFIVPHDPGPAPDECDVCWFQNLDPPIVKLSYDILIDGHPTCPNMDQHP